jgi:hypothetical protein
MRKAYSVADVSSHMADGTLVLRRGPARKPGCAMFPAALDRADVRRRYASGLLRLTGANYVMLPVMLATRAGRRAVLNMVYKAAYDSARATVGQSAQAARWTAVKYTRAIVAQLIPARREWRQTEAYAKANRLGARRAHDNPTASYYTSTTVVKVAPVACKVYGNVKSTMMPPPAVQYHMGKGLASILCNDNGDITDY